MWKFLVKQQKIEILEREVIADQQISFVNLKFVFDGDWKKFHKVVQFTQCDETYNRVLGTDGLSCLLPSELHAGAVRISVFGYDAENINGLRATTVPVTLNVRQSGFVGDGVEEVPPTPDLYTQLLQKLEEKASSLQNGVDGKDGENGLSAYEIAQNNGFEGTPAEWLASLKGEKGDTGKQGVKGDKGDKGDTGEQGIQGEKGSTGATGKTGASGKSAYEIWLSAGNSGTETDFLNSLKGEKGDKGDTGSAAVDIEKIEEQLAELTNRDAWWGNFNPVGRAEYPTACDTYYVPTGQKRTFAVVPRIADIENNALNNSPAGMFVPDLSGRVENLETSSHTHKNKEFLDSIE
ncbi:MAG: collagen-like protein, partial [Ruminococcus sp.]|nr:collagen-like protein [Ruminococcus sp.]